ncbi:MAG TPA: type 4a pilus biogenesis protein PilO [Solirubrobacterales bacterium]
MKLSSSNKLIIVMVVIAVLAAGFWMLVLTPEREEADKLGKQVEKLEASLASHQAEAQQALEARDKFPRTYEELVVLGKAVPADDDTASLIVQLNRIADSAGVKFRELKLASANSEESEPTATEAPAGELVSPTEVAASTLPLGATVGSAGLAVMPYELIFDGEFFEIADFIEGIDKLVKTKTGQVTVNGRLFTISGFSLEPTQEKPFPALEATFFITTYLTPPDEGATAGATAEGPAEAAPASTTIGGTP